MAMAFLEVLLLITPFILGVYASSMLEARQSSLPTGWTAVGCYSDSNEARTLRTAAYTDPTGMTIESCIAFCSPSAFVYAGLEFSRECYCDNVIESPGAPISDSTCNMPCTGNAAETCGGPGGINIFQNTALPPPPPPPPAATIKQVAGTYQYKGCFQDGVNGAPRSLSNRVTVFAGVSAESCTAACKSAGYPLAGLEFGQECWCDVYMPLANVSPDSECNMPCQADNTELCGAGNRLAIYQDTTATPPAADQCLSATQLHSSSAGSFSVFRLFAVPTSGSGATIQLGNHELASRPGQPTNIILTRSGNEGSTYYLAANGLYPEFVLGGGNAIPIFPAPVQTFLVWSVGIPAYSGYCAKPNPISTFGPFIGPPALSVDGHADRWAFCDGGVSYLVSSNANCTSVVLLMTQPKMP